MAFKQKNLKHWSNDDVSDWIKSIQLSNEGQRDILKAITECECTGQDWFSAKSSKDIQSLFGIKQPMLALRIYREFSKIKNEQIKNIAITAARNLPHSTLTSITEEQKSFQLHIFGQNKYWNMPTVERVKQLYADYSGCEVGGVILSARGKILSDNRTLGQYSITNENHLITVIFRVRGGMAALKDNDRKRVIQFNKYALKQSHKADCLIGFDDNDDIDRADIGCPKAHAMAADTMFNYIVSCLEKNLKAVNILCPHCKTVLDWDTCTKIADMTGKEYAKWTEIIERRLQPQIKQCPYCIAECEREKGVSVFKMNCSACNNNDWCWNCLRPWNGDGLIFCGNNNCRLIQDVNRILSETNVCTPRYLKTVKIPQIRACPKCMTLIRMDDGVDSKHMRCNACRASFCFVCLRIKSGDSWPCGSYDFECQAQPLQIFGK